MQATNNGKVMTKQWDEITNTKWEKTTVKWKTHSKQATNNDERWRSEMTHTKWRGNQWWKKSDQKQAINNGKVIKKQWDEIGRQKEEKTTICEKTPISETKTI